MIDRVKPSCEVEGGKASWINASSSTTSRIVTATCKDEDSGCVTESFSKTYKNDINTKTAGANGNNKGGTVYDKAGNSKKCSANQTVKIDKTEPTCGEIKISGTKGDNNWYKSNVTISATDGSDTLSGHKSTIVSPEEIKNNTTGTSVKLTTEDNAGNKCTKSTTIKIDKTKPTITCTLDNNNLTSGINVAVSATDKGGSGLKKYQNSYLNMTETFKITVKDNAGNKNSCDVNIESIAQTRNRTRTY